MVSSPPASQPCTQTAAKGRLVKVILLGIICDHPAMCKMSRFSDHSHNQAPCTKCTITQEELFSECSLRNRESSQLPFYTFNNLQGSHHETERIIVGSASNGGISRQKTNTKNSFLSTVPTGLNLQGYLISIWYITRLLTPCIICYSVSYFRTNAFAILILIQASQKLSGTLSGSQGNLRRFGQALQSELVNLTLSTNSSRR